MGRKQRQFHRLVWHGAAGIVAVWALGIPIAAAQTFEPTSGTHAWNDDNNWGPSPPQAFPNWSGADAIIQAPTGHLNIELNQPITLGGLTVNKATSGNFNTTIVGSETNTLTFDGGTATLFNDFSSVGTGLTIISAPIVFDGPFNVKQGDNDVLRFTSSLSGAGSLTVNRNTDGDGIVAFNAANTYEGSTTVAGNTGTNFTVLRLNHAEAIPGGIGATGGTSNITLTASAILGLGAGDFLRGIGTGPDQIRFQAAANSGFAAYGGNRAVNFGGEGATVTWGQAGFGTLVLGAQTADGTIDFQNPLNLGNGTTNRNVRVPDGAAAIDAVFSQTISSSGTGTLTKLGGGTLSLAAANTYTGNTNITGGVLRLDHPQALPATTNVLLNGTGRLGLGAGDLAIDLGAGPGQLQFDSSASNNNGGFAAYGGERSVTLNGGAQLVWGEGYFVANGANLILSSEDSDSTINFHNPIDLNGQQRTIAARQGSVAIDARITGVISGTGPGSGITKEQEGILELAAANTYEGPTIIDVGTLLLTNENSIPGGINGGNIANIVLGAVIGLGLENFTSDIGFGPGQVSFDPTSVGGFAAYFGDRVVNLGGASAQLVWGTGAFSPTTLVLSAIDASGTLDFQNPIDLNGEVRQIDGRTGLAEIDGLVSNVISGVGAIRKGGNGTLAFGAANTYDGGTTVTAGRLVVTNTTGSGVGSGDVVVQAGTLGGTGFIGTPDDASNVTVNSGARLAPGVLAGRLTIFGDVSLASGSFFDIQLAGTSEGSEYDQLVVHGAVNTEARLRVSLLDSFLPTLGNTFEILTATNGINGSFASPELPALGAGLAWEVLQTADSLSLVVVAGELLAGDYNRDGVVDARDYTVWRNSLGQVGTGLAADGNGDNQIDAEDYTIWKNNFGASGGGLAANLQHVPEPTSLAILGLSAFIPWILRRARRVRPAFDHFRESGEA